MAAKQYRVNGKRVPSVSTLVKHIDGDAGGLIAWANRMGLEGTTLEEARDHVTGVGVIAHACVEADIRGEAIDLNKVPEAMRVPVEMSLAAWHAWKRSAKPDFLGAEIELVSKEHLFGGTSDFVARIGGVVTLGDLKTGKLYPPAIAQIGGYAILWDEHHPEAPIERVDLLRVDKETGAFTHKSIGDVAIAKRAFLQAREIYETAKQLKRMC